MSPGSWGETGLQGGLVPLMASSAFGARLPLGEEGEQRVQMVVVPSGRPVTGGPGVAGRGVG